MILVAGGAGYIGSHLCRALQEANEPFVVLDNLSSGHREAVAGATLVEADLADRDALERVFHDHDVDLVMHFAASISVGESVRDPAKYWRNNFFGTLNLVQAMAAAGVNRLVFSSTAAIFGEPVKLPIDEDHPCSPVNPYGATKLAVERMLEAYDAGHGLRSVCLRYFNACGAHPSGELGEDHTPEEHLIPVAIQAGLGQRGPLSVFGTDYPTPDGTCVRDYVHIADLAEAHLLAARHLRQGGDSRRFNLGNGEGFSVRQVIHTVEEVSGRSVPHHEAPRREGDPAQLVASSRRIRDEWGWSPSFPELETIVEHAWRWHSTHPNGYRS